MALTTGAVATLWIDAAIRRMIDRRRRHAVRHLSFVYDPATGEYEDSHCIGIKGYHILTDERERPRAQNDPKLSKKKSVLTLIYENPVDRPHFSVSASHAILFQVICNDDDFTYLDFDWQGAKVPVQVDVFIFNPAQSVPLHNWEHHWHEVVEKPQRTDINRSEAAGRA